MEQYANNNGTQIHYRIRGKGDPLVLIMGFGADGNTWEKHAAVYENHFTCIVLDNRGVGKSDQPKGPYTTAVMASDAIAVMDALKIDRAHISGISMGGAISQELAINYPERVRSLSLISTWPQFDVFTKTVYHNLKKLRRTSDPEDFMELLQLWIFAPPYFENHFDVLKDGQQAAAENPTPQTQAGFEGQLDACILHDTISRLDQIKVPTLITVGERDIFTPVKFSKTLHEGIQGSEFVVFPNTGHVHHWEALEEFNQLTTSFLLQH